MTNGIVNNWKTNDKMLIEEIQSNSLLNRVRKIFSHGSALIDQEMEQRNPPSPVEMRRMELSFAEEIIREVENELG